MDLIVSLPDDIVPQLQAGGVDLPRQALEAIALEAYKNDRITKKQLRELLGFETRYELDGFFKALKFYDGCTAEEIMEQVEAVQRLGF